MQLIRGLLFKQFIRTHISNIDVSSSEYRSSNTETWGPSQLEQLERLRSEDTPRRLMITHTIGSQVKKIIDLELKTLQSRHDFQSQGQMTLKI